MEDVTISSKVVTGKRVSMWHEFRDNPLAGVVQLGSPIVLLAIAVKLVVSHAGMGLGGYILYGVIAIAALIGTFVLLGTRKSLILDCECPGCGAPGRRHFKAPDEFRKVPFDTCDRCMICMSANGLEVSELPLEALDSFMIGRDQYAHAVRRDDKGEIHLELPPMCTICGSRDVAATRSIMSYDFGGGDGLSTVVNEVNYARTGTTRDRFVDRASASHDGELDMLSLCKVQVPLCKAHTEKARPLPYPISCSQQCDLWFESYRYYKAFCAANHVKPPAAVGDQLPRATANQRH